MALLADIKPWIGVFLSFCATFIWRLTGLLLAERLSPNSLLMLWINSVAYSMVAGVLVLIIVNPTGVLLTSTLESRILGLLSGIVAVFFTRKLLISIMVGMLVFGALAGL